MNNNQDNFISIIIPVYNAEKYIEKLLHSLFNQTYEGDFEIIAVDNKSTDNSRAILDKYKDKVIILDENKKTGPGAARNKGIANSKGRIIAFTDADCVADKNWLKNGIRNINENNGDIIGGKVKFYFSKKPTISEYFDSTFHLQNEITIKNIGAAATCNLFTRKKVFNKIGFFPELDGEDFIWTKKATKHNFKLKYCKNTIIYHPARKFKSLFKKQLRVGKGMKNRNEKFKLKEILPIYSIKYVNNMVKNNDNEIILKDKLIHLWMIASFYKFIKLVSYFFSFIKYKHK
jgi:glycosyltransferase involved in cell wall biosynthesis